MVSLRTMKSPKNIFRRIVLVCSWVCFFSFPCVSLLAQDAVFTNNTTTACSDDISGAAAGGYVNFRTVTVSGLPTSLSCGGTVLKQVNIRMGSPSCKGNLSTYKARLISPSGGIIQLFGDSTAGGSGFTGSGTSMWMDIKLRDDPALERVSEYTNTVQQNYFPYSIGYYRTTSNHAFSFVNGTNPNGNWVLQIAENTSSEVSFQKIDLIFGAKTSVKDITSCSGDNNFCAGSTCLGGEDIVRVNNNGYSQNDPAYMGNTVDGCGWNGANNNSAWLHFFASGTTAKITLSGLKAAASSGSSDQQAIVLVAPASCATIPTLVATGGCPDDESLNNMAYLSSNGGGVTTAGNVYSNGITANCEFNLSGLTPGQKYYLYIDGNGGNASHLYVEMVSGAQSCNLSGVVELATASTNNISLLKKVCDDGDWTYYADPSNDTRLLFGIQWNIGNASCGAIATNNQNIKDNATVKLFVEPDLYGEKNPAAKKATFTMKRWFEIEKNTPTNLTNPVNIRFFYDPNEVTAVLDSAALFASTYGVNTEPFQWFKVDGTYDATTPATVVTPDTITGAGLTLLTDMNTGGNTINGVIYAQFNGLMSFSAGTGAAGASGGAPLPVTWVSFSGYSQHLSNTLSWVTLQEVNNAYFQVERGETPEKMEKIGQIKSSGNSDTPNPYFFIDYDIRQPSYYYRIKQIDLNGDISYSSTIQITNEFEYFNLYPNPAQEFITLHAYRPVSKVAIYDMLGKLLKTEVLTNGSTISLSGMDKGVYFVHSFFDNGASEITKLIKE